MKKYIKTTAKNAIEKGLLKVGDEIQIIAKIKKIDGLEVKIETEDHNNIWLYNSTIRIPKPEPKPIDFGEAGRVLKYNQYVVMTTGDATDIFFSGYLLEPANNCRKGYTSNTFTISNDWQDITDTYKL